MVLQNADDVLLPIVTVQDVDGTRVVRNETIHENTIEQAKVLLYTL